MVWEKTPPVRAAPPGAWPRAAFRLLAALCSLFFASCSAVTGKFRVMAGNLLYGGGRYTGAITNYLAASEDERTAPYAEYGLGVIYLAMNEEDAALGRFDAAGAALDGAEHNELRYRLHYNRGIIFFEREDFSRAAAEFRKALESGPGHVEAKRNLELSLLSYEQRRREDPGARTGHEEPGEADDILYEYLRREEEKRWRNQEWTGDAPFSGPDY